MKPLRVLLVDDHQLVRAGLRALLERIDGVEVVGEADDGRDAIEALKETRPHIVLMDILMPGMNGLDATAHLVKKHPDIHVVILSMNKTREFVLQSIKAGARGYLLKNAKIAELEQALRAVAAGEIYLSPQIAGHVVDDYRRSATPDDPLTGRQREVLQLVAEGLSTKQIAKRLGISVKTVEMYRGQIMKALDIHDIAGLTRYAIRVGLTSVDS